MRERAVRTRRAPLGARRRTCQIASFTPRVKKHGLSGSLAVRHFFWSEPGPGPWFSRITRHETRITAFYRVFRPSGGEKCRLALVAVAISAAVLSSQTAAWVHRSRSRSHAPARRHGRRRFGRGLEAARRQASLHAESQERHLAVHAWRRQPSGILRSQTGCQQIRRKEDHRDALQGFARLPSPQREPP